MLAKQRELMKFYWSDQTEIEQAIAAKEVSPPMLERSVAQLKKQGVRSPTWCPRKAHRHSCGLVRHAKAPGDEQAAYDFLNAMLDPESGKWLIEQSGYFTRTAAATRSSIQGSLRHRRPIREATFARSRSTPSRRPTAEIHRAVNNREGGVIALCGRGVARPNRFSHLRNLLRFKRIDGPEYGPIILLRFLRNSLNPPTEPPAFDIRR